MKSALVQERDEVEVVLASSKAAVQIYQAYEEAGTDLAQALGKKAAIKKQARPCSPPTAVPPAPRLPASPAHHRTYWHGRHRKA